MPNDNFSHHVNLFCCLICYYIFLLSLFKKIPFKLKDEEIADILSGDTSDIEELYENDINLDNLDELLMNVNDVYEVSFYLI